MIPIDFLIGDLKVNTFGLFLVIGLLFSLFVVWSEGRKDGFDTNRLFDLFLLSLVAGFFLSRFTFAIRSHFIFRAIFLHVLQIWVSGYDSYGFLVGILVVSLFLPRKWKWSVFRILDILALALAFGGSIVALGVVALQKDFRFLFVFAGFTLIYVFLSKLRDSYLKSGVSFSLFLIFLAAMGFAFFREGSYLIFYPILITISLLNLIIRGKIMPNKMLPKSILDLFKKNLLRKESSLEKEEQLLSEADPYLKEGRDKGNADEVDEAILEDAQKELIDIKKSSVALALSKVRKALARLKLGKYGICEVCGVKIEAARLKIYPEASTCASCAAKTRV